MMAQETGYLKAYEVFQKICEFLETASADGLRLDEVERTVQAYLAQQGLAFLEEHVDNAGDGDEGETVCSEERVLQRSEEPHERRYLSIFGELTISRYVYSAGKKRAIEYAPLDARLGLPAGEISYVLEDYQERLCAKSPFAKGVEDLKSILGTAVSVATAEAMNRQMAGFAQSYHTSGLTEGKMPPTSDERELLVAAADGKGVPIRRSLEQRLEEERAAVSAGSSSKPPPSRQGTSRKDRRRSVARKTKRRRRESKNEEVAEDSSWGDERKGKKQMAYVGAVYTIDRFPRTADDVLDEVLRRECQNKRPRPQHKHVWGEMTQLKEGEPINGRSLLFIDLALQCHYRDPDRKKTLVCLMDGEEPLWTAQAEWLERAVPILDFFHALERLWKLAKLFHEGRAAEAFVEHHARMFLEGKVDYAVRNFGRLLKDLGPRSEEAAEVRRAIGYFRHNRDRMHYDEYLAQGYPIGSGAAEGTCRNLVKDRLELAGMKWEYTGAQAMIYLRALYRSGDWEPFINYRIEKEQERLYGKDTIYDQLMPYGQAM